MAGTNIGLKDWLLGWIIANPTAGAKGTVGIQAVTLVNSTGTELVVGDSLTWVPLGYAQDTTISAASALPTVPAATTVALIQAEGANIRWRDDGVDPTASVGMLLGAGTAFWYRGTFAAFKVIQVSGGGILNVSYYQEISE